MNYQRIYNDRQYYSSDDISDNEIDDNSELEEDFEMDNSRLNYENKNNYLLIGSADRDWTNLYKNTFSFQVRFNASESSNETKEVFTNLDNNIDNINRFNRTLTTERYSGSKSLSIPINIKNINSITINRILFPTRNIYLGNGDFINLIDLKNINVVIDEFSNVNYGSNELSNFYFSSLIMFTPIYPETNSTKVPNFVEFKNVRLIDKEFKPAPLNTINSLTFSFYDSLGNKLNYLNNTLTIKDLDYDNDSNKFIKVTTNEFFYRKNYRENDIIIIKNIQNNLLKDFLERKRGHKIYFNANYTDEVSSNSNTVPALQNVFYIIKKGEFNNEGIYSISETTTGIINNLGGNILNNNLQIQIYMTINSKHKSLDIFNSRII